MNNILYKISLFSAVVLLGGFTTILTGCSDYTEIQPKGKNLLQTTGEIEGLLNIEYGTANPDVRVMAGDIVKTFSNVASDISNPSKTRNIILITWDEANQETMADLTGSDSDYDDFYSIIGGICNPILQQVDQAQGDEAKKKQLKSEALLMRGYYHFLLVNKFAKAYNASTAANDGGIIYMTEDVDITVPQSPKSVKEVYELCLKDINEAISLDGLPKDAINRMRMNKASAYAAKAVVLVAMQDWEQAEAAAKQALQLNPTVTDYTQMLHQPITGYFIGNRYDAMMRTKLECEEDLFYTYNQEYFNFIVAESAERIEKGNYAYEKLAVDRMFYDYMMGMGSMYIGLDYTATWDMESGWNYEGLKTSYLYCIIAECEQHKGNINAAMEAIDKVRVCRIDPSGYQPLKGNVTDNAIAIDYIKKTWSGEGMWSWYNFLCRKRWTQVDGYKETLTKEMNGITYSLKPDSKFWVFPFPKNVTDKNPNLKQNYR
ncbi:MAG: RagB/SusD family nutrient uptake outer membrane protein [Prevotella sp.]|nr:RagB/SusD family nutrient uptake outer membrane protein [Prevotella sp.]MBQ6657817.1 RagB/SusD family nutrient uptake outer membrane protein [Prevotella sp.]MBQ7716785.1 RagB/SusD family nutrient uptake outer membrane protein [Prevotella sp.]